MFAEKKDDYKKLRELFGKCLQYNIRRVIKKNLVNKCLVMFAVPAEKKDDY